MNKCIPYVIGVDPSGNFNEGKGTTGITIIQGHDIIDDIEVCASDYPTRLNYWAGVVVIIRGLQRKYATPHVVIEDYRLYGDKAKSQTNSELETSRLLGVLEWEFMDAKYQMASEVKSRWSNSVLSKSEIDIKQLKSKHTVDALRHALHYDLKLRRVGYADRQYNATKRSEDISSRCY